jgi:hypothetical protein
MEEVKKLDSAAAKDWYFDNCKLDCSVDAKFYGDHMLDEKNFGAKQAKEAAFGRFKKNKTTTCSWIWIDKQTLFNKVRGSNKNRAGIHSGNQQLAVELKVQRRTVWIEELDKKDVAKGKFKDPENLGDDRHPLWVICQSRLEENIKISVVGPWNPLKGDFTIHHYEEKGMSGQPQVIDKYRFFIIRDKEIIRPEATK